MGCLTTIDNKEKGSYFSIPLGLINLAVPSGLEIYGRNPILIEINRIFPFNFNKSWISPCKSTNEFKLGLVYGQTLKQKENFCSLKHQHLSQGSTILLKLQKCQLVPGEYHTDVWGPVHIYTGATYIVFVY